eukprot:scaffold28066_cov119-Isochrysis_galbana.AAC.1
MDKKREGGGEARYINTCGCEGSRRGPRIVAGPRRCASARRPASAGERRECKRRCGASGHRTHRARP